MNWQIDYAAKSAGGKDERTLQKRTWNEAEAVREVISFLKEVLRASPTKGLTQMTVSIRQK